MTSAECSQIGESKFYKFAINYYGYYDNGVNEHEVYLASYLLGFLCIAEIFWIIKIQFLAIKKLKRLESFKETINDDDWKELYMKTPGWIVQLCRLSLCF